MRIFSEKGPLTLVYIVLAGLLVLAISGCSFSLAEDITPPPGSEQRPPAMPQPAAVSGDLYPLVMPNPEAGQAIYREKCAPCHGEGGLGDGPQAAQLPNPVAPIGSLALARQSSPADWYTQVTQGNLERFMPPFGSLSDRQRWDVVAYSFSLTTPTSVVTQGEALYQENCARCHGDSGQGDGPEAASLATPLPDFSDQSSMVQLSAADLLMATSAGISPNMPAFSEQLSEDELWAVSAYLRSLTFPVSSEAIASSDTTSTEAAPETTEVSTTDSASPIATPLAAANASSGDITGSVTSASGTELPAGLEITLHAFDDMQQVMTQTVTTQSDGTFLFPDVEMMPGRVFMATVSYQRASYGSDIGRVEEGMTAIDLPISVYETTDDASVLSADRLHLFFEFIDASTVRIIELYIISNNSDTTLVAAEPGEPTVQFTLPEGATGLEFQDGALGGRYVQTAGGFGDTIAVRPGSGAYEVLFAYQLPYDRKLELSRLLNLPVDAVVILVPEGEIKIKSDGLQDGGTLDVQGSPYHSYNGGGLTAGDTLSLTLTGRPSSGTPTLATGSNTSLLVGLGVFGMALLASGIWLFNRTRKAGVQSDEEIDEIPPAGRETPESLMDAIIALDDLYQAGELPDEAYHTRRDELKSRLKDTMQG